jgi:hypothetical protein
MLVACLGCPSLRIGISQINLGGSVSAPGQRNSTQALVALEPSPAGEVRVGAVTATSSLILEVLIFGP